MQCQKYGDMAKNNKDVRRGIVLYLDGKEVKNNATAIQAEIKKVRTELNNADVSDIAKILI